MNQQKIRSPDWLSQGTMEYVVCPFCGSEGGPSLIEIGIEPDMKTSGQQIEIQCGRCQRRGSISCALSSLGRVYQAVWPDNSPEDKPTPNVSLMSARPDKTEAGVQRDWSQSLMLRYAAELNHVITQTTKAVQALQQTVEGQSERIRHKLELEETIVVGCLERSQKHGHDFHKDLDSRQAQLRSETELHSKLLGESIRKSTKEVEMEVEKFAQDVNYRIVTELLEKPAASISKLLKHAGKLADATVQLQKRIANSEQSLAALHETLEHIVQRIRPVGDDSRYMLRLVSDKDVEQMHVDLVRVALSPSNIRRIVSEYFDDSKQRLADRTAIVDRLPDLFDVIERRLQSWKNRKDVESAALQQAVRDVLEEVWGSITYWQKVNGIERFAVPEEPYDQHWHTMESSDYLAKHDLQDIIGEVKYSGYRFRTGELLRKAIVTVKVMPDVLQD